MGTELNGNMCWYLSRQHEHFHTILHKPFLSVSVSVSGSVNERRSSYNANDKNEAINYCTITSGIYVNSCQKKSKDKTSLLPAQLVVLQSFVLVGRISADCS